MTGTRKIPAARDKTLFTPGPLTTSPTVKQAMLRDLGSRDVEFIETVRSIRVALLGLAGVSQETGYEAVLMQGSGTFGLESVIGSTISPDGKLLVIINGAYGDRIEERREPGGLEEKSACLPTRASVLELASLQDSRDPLTSPLRDPLFRLTTSSLELLRALLRAPGRTDAWPASRDPKRARWTDRVSVGQRKLLTGRASPYGRNKGKSRRKACLREDHVQVAVS